MKGLPKPILNCIIEHATPDDFGQFLLMSRHVWKVFGKVVKDLRWDMYNIKNRFTSLSCVKYQTQTLCIEAVKHDALALCFIKIHTPKICQEAIRLNPVAKYYIRK